MAEGGAAVVIPDRRAHRRAAERARSPSCSRDEDRLRAMSIAARRLAKPDAAERIAREVLRRRAMAEPMNGRRLHFIAIGGAGMSGLALVARQLGAEVTGSDRAESSYLERLRAAGIEPAARPRRRRTCPPDAEVVVSTAIPRGQPRAGACPRARSAGDPPRRAARRALRPSAGCWPSPAPTARPRRPRCASGAARRRAPTRPSSSAASCRAPDPAARPRTPAGARASGWWSRPTRATPASSSCSPRWR